MEKKTIGGFIAALRKANGMTQKDLAERLNVSDKTVSRWEQDNGAPDLSLIPVIAEVFGVTCDELLRGERKSPELRIGSAEEAEPSPRAEKQLQRLLKSSLSQFQNLTYVAMGISALGLITALICNLAFTSALLGFLLGAAFFAASIVLQAIFINQAFLRVEDSGLSAPELSDYKRRVLRWAQRSIGVTVAFLGFTFPLILVDAYMGLGADSLLLFGLPGAAVFLLIYAVVLYFLNARLYRTDAYRLNEQKAAVYFHNHKLKRKCAVWLVIVLLVTVIAHAAVTERWDAYDLSDGTQFYDYESFADFMEQDLDSPGYNEAPSTPVAPDREYGNDFDEEELYRQELTLSDGTVVCSYVSRNGTVARICYADNDSLLPITVITYSDLIGGQTMLLLFNASFVAAYFLESLAAVLVYFKKKAK